MAKAVGYIRVSTDEQHLGPEAQRDALAVWCKAKGYDLVAVYHEDVSGGAPLDKRAALLDAIDALEEHGAGYLVAMKRDRLARDVMIAAMIERLVERKGARIATTDGTSDGDGPEALLVRGVMDLFAQYERAVIRARTKSALAVKQKRGERTGQVPYGYRLATDGVHLEADGAEQEIVGMVRQLRAEGISIRGIADRLNDQGVSARGSRWHPTTIARLLKKEAA